MSNRVSVSVVKKVLGSAVRKSIMLYFADKASDDGRGIFSSKGTISAELEISRSTVIANINELVEEGLLIVVGDRRHPNGVTVEYDIDLEALDRLPNVKDKPNDPSGSRTRPTAGPVREPDTTCPAAGHDPSGSRTQTILEPSFNLVCVDAEAQRETDAAFERFWDAHPRPRSKDACRDLFDQAVRSGEDPNRIAAAAEAYRAENKGNARQYVAYADNWLRDDRWEDHREAEGGKQGQPCASGDLAAFWAKKISAGVYVAPSAISAKMATEMLSRRLVSEAELRRIGV
ncbi:helix-turn-helix domain-containing protein [Salipiger sp. PrR003]|uniref:helix-turn-helix domain-containing protein n=1 Tax=Salipiger sp. PrR003 TaxID=2706776 RepID=UPI0013DAD5F8|nr:helix-turn-helix domain-containing protein [Salipiger sp. PrR003]NDV52175.1 hypothetical protein [Salipiger sp. PrR003]NDV52201.1 hypothetical protein [Salipiger sp. PrR003]